MQTAAVILSGPRSLALGRLDLSAPVAGDVVVEVSHSGISTGTEKLFWDGRMPPFPGMGYPLVPGYEAAGEVVEAPPGSQLKVGRPRVRAGCDLLWPGEGPVRGRCAAIS